MFSELYSTFISWENTSKGNRLFQRIWLGGLILKGALGNQLSFCKQAMTALVNHSLEMWQSHFQHTAPESQQRPVWGRVPLVCVILCLTLGCLLLSWFQMICSSGSNGSRFISCKASYCGWFTCFIFNFCIKCHVAKAIHIMLIFINSVAFFICIAKALNGTKTLCLQRDGWEPRTDLSINQKSAHLCSEKGPKKRWSADTKAMISTWRRVDSVVPSQASCSTRKNSY